MAKLERKIECCGAGFESEHIPLTGVITFSYPCVVVLTPLWLVLSAASIPLPFLRRSARFFDVFISANLKIIQKADLAPAWKCALTSRLVSTSPRFAGLIFRYFNLTALSLFFAVPAAVVAMVRFAWS